MDTFTFFYNGPFSQWYACEFTIGGVTYANAEQYMMAEKARLFGDADAEAKIMATASPREAKKLGRSVRNFDEGRWNSVARDVVYRGNYAKFTQNPPLRDALMATKGTVLVEASPTDQIWGIGLAESDLRVENPAYWRGTNWLGEVLTKVRDDIEAGAERTRDFGWSSPASAVSVSVKITNKRLTDLWSWDFDQMKRQAAEMAKAFSAVKQVEVVVRNARDDADRTEVEVLASTDQKIFTAKSVSAGGVMTAFRDALHEARQQLRGPSKRAVRL